MRILLLDLGREWRGGQRQVLYLARHLAAAPGFEPVLACPSGSPLARRALDEGLDTVPLPGAREFNPLVQAKVLSLSRSADILHTNDARGASLGALVRLLCPGLKLVHSRRVSYALGRGWSRRKYFLAHAVVAVSRDVADVLAASGVDPQRIRVVHSGIDASLYTPRQAPPGDAGVVLGMIGALSPQKGHQVFLDSLAILAGRDGLPPWRAVVVGDGELRGELEDRAKALGLGGKVEFTGYRDSWDALLDFDVLAVPSVDGEGSNAVVKEGWAARVPVVASDLPANLELVEPGVSGLVFENRNPAALAEVLAKAATDRATRDSLAAAGEKRAVLFSDLAMARGVMDIYRSLS